VPADPVKVRYPEMLLESVKVASGIGVWLPLERSAV